MLNQKKEYSYGVRILIIVIIFNLAIFGSQFIKKEVCENKGGSYEFVGNELSENVSIGFLKCVK